MNDLKSFKDRLLTVRDTHFGDFALELFHFQALHNPVYKDFITSLGISPEDVLTVADIPFLPISAFKHRIVKTLDWEESSVFESSGTSGQQPSRNYVEDIGFYEGISTRIFENFYGSPEDYHILALLPSYLERGSSSLVHMVQHFIKLSRSGYSGFYLTNVRELNDRLGHLIGKTDRKIMLWGVTYALIDFAEQYQPDLKDGIVIETGGMKGRREAMVREKVHGILMEGFGLQAVHSEYGMTELLSQAYAAGRGLYRCPPWMRVYTREINDPFCPVEEGGQGVINIIDLANIHSCAFIATEDLGRVFEDGTFEVLGRLDNADMRGCNLMVN